MKIENIKKVEILIQEINALESFIHELPDNGTTSDQIIFGNNETNVAELKTVFKGKNLQVYIKDLKELVFQNAKEKLKKLKESLIDM